VDAWTFEAQVASDTAAYEDPSPWGGLAHDLVRGHDATASLSPALRCAALELARFHAQKNAMPAESLRRFVVARSGAATTAINPLYLSLAEGRGSRARSRRRPHRALGGARGRGG